MLIISFDDVVTGSGRGTHNVVILGVEKQGIGVTRGHVPELTEVVGVHTCIIQHVLDIGGPTETRVQIGVQFEREDETHMDTHLCTSMYYRSALDLIKLYL